MTNEMKKEMMTMYNAKPLLKGMFLAVCAGLQTAMVLLPWVMPAMPWMSAVLGGSAILWMVYAVMLERTCASVFNRAEFYRLLLNAQALDTAENLDGTKEDGSLSKEQENE